MILKTVRWCVLITLLFMATLADRMSDYLPGNIVIEFLWKGVFSVAVVTLPLDR